MVLHRDVHYEIAVSGHYALLNPTMRLSFFIRSSALPTVGHRKFINLRMAEPDCGWGQEKGFAS